MSAPNEKPNPSLFSKEGVLRATEALGLGDDKPPLPLEPQRSEEHSNYPEALRDAERVGEDGNPLPREWDVGVALSGGGIRSATLSLGIFQGLAKRGLIKEVDYLSTVSGGGYFGSFLGRLFTRPDLDELAPDEGDPDSETSGSEKEKGPVERILLDNMSKPIRFLRENGRYLAPRGTPDLAVAGAVAFRNWVAVQFVMATFAVFFLGVSALLRYGILSWFPEQGASLPGVLRGPILSHHFWLSPYLPLGAILFLILAVPFGWAYWLARDSRQAESLRSRFLSWFFRWIPTLALTVAFFWIVGAGSIPFLESLGDPLLAVGGMAMLTTVYYLLCRWQAHRKTRHDATEKSEGDKETSEGEKVSTPQSRVAYQRRLLSHNLARALLVVVAVLFLGLVDTAGQSLLLLGQRVTTQTISVYALLASVLAALRPVVSSLLEGSSTKKLPGFLSSALVYVAALVVLLLVLAPAAMVPHLVVWYGELARVSAAAGLMSPLHPLTPRGWFGPLMAFVVGAGVLSWFMGQVWPFVNRSSLNALYEARLRRAYMGASNPARFGEGDDRPLETETHRDDGAGIRDYNPQWKGGPVHLINVTVNQTIGGRSQVERRDRKGLPLAVGPGGISVGRGNHATWDKSETDALLTRPPFWGRWFKTREEKGFEIFYERSTPESLDIGQWVAISGAAFSTGLGSRTSFGLSLLAGLFNVRLGYWWDSALNPAQRPGRTTRTLSKRVGSLLRLPFPAQMALLDEWLARFPGVDAESWYLTDGGHFENMGAYELIRRGLKHIIICDNEQDARYTYSGLANLVRKARTDFGAKIEFLDERDIGRRVRGTRLKRWLCTLEKLRRGQWTEEPVRDPTTKKNRLLNLGADEQRFSLGHAAVAKITYAEPREDGTTDGYLLYIKPTLVGDEPVDILQYHTEHPDFPHETTADQFFDEEQWESYRRLGEHISDKLFRRGLLDWVPRV